MNRSLERLRNMLLQETQLVKKKQQQEQLKETHKGLDFTDHLFPTESSLNV